MFLNFDPNKETHISAHLRRMNRGAAFAALRVLVLLAVLNVLLATRTSADPVISGPRLAFDVKEGLNLNSFLRQGQVAAHLVLRAGADPRMLVAFPAGNSGVAVWFSHVSQPVSWELIGEPLPSSAKDGKGRPLFGIKVQATVTAASLSIKKVLLSNVRVFRDYQYWGTSPEIVDTAAKVSGRTLSWDRNRLDGEAGYRLILKITHGTIKDGAIVAGGDGKIGMILSAYTGEVPLHPLTGRQLLNASAQGDAAARNSLEFLSYREKLLAGSWRFNTYFGRDTLMTLRLLLPALTPKAIDAGLGAVMARLSSSGEVAHEEDIGEYAILDHLRDGGSQSAEPVFDYKMIDANYMLPAVLGAWLLDDPRGRSSAQYLLARANERDGDIRRPLGKDLVKNLRFVVDSATPFANDPRATNLIRVKDGHLAGQWRDSDEGIGGGRYPFDVNAVLVPAALDAVARLLQNGLLDGYVDQEDRTVLSSAAEKAKTWRAKAGDLFRVKILNEEARADVKSYAASLGVSADAALNSLGTADEEFRALALDAHGSPIQVVNSDETFELLFDNPDANALDRILNTVMRPFPAGLMTDAGMVVANPVFATQALQSHFTKNHYHGTVVWSWQQAMFAEGLDRQLLRDDLPDAMKAKLREAQQQLWRAIQAGRQVSNSELWSWRYRDGAYEIAPFGASGADVDESNAAQLWSTVYLAIHAPVAPPQ